MNRQICAASQFLFGLSILSNFEPVAAKTVQRSRQLGTTPLTGCKCKEENTHFSISKTGRHIDKHAARALLLTEASYK